MIRRFFVFCAVLLMVFAAQSVYATTYDIWDLFPDSQGGNGISAYGYNGGYTLLNDLGSYYFGRSGGSWNTPYITRGTDPWIVTHPWSDMDSQLVWTVPQTNTYDIAGAFNDWGDGGYVYTYILKNNGIVWSSYLGSGTVSFSFDDLALNANDKIAFGVGYAGSVSDDTTKYWASATFSPIGPAVPEPASMAFLGLGAFGLLGLRKKKSV